MKANIFLNKTILVTGGTGSIGSVLVEKIAKLKPKEIRVFSNDEYQLFKMREQKKLIKLMIGDITNFDEIDKATEGCDMVFHTAALKHITMCELNPMMAITTNVLGTQNVLRASIGKAKIFVNITTDKAANPVSTLGATKLLGEKLTSSSNRAENHTKCWSVRFGNVIGSRGSVYEAFLNQLEKGKNLQLTDKRMTRFIMSINQASDLILKTCSIAKGGEVFILKMPTIKIKDLAEIINSEYCKKHHIKTRKIEIIGIREAEKLYEELMTESEALLSYETKELFIITSPFENHKYPGLKKTVQKSYRSNDVRSLSKKEIRELLSDF